MESRQSRMDKYYDVDVDIDIDDSTINSRIRKNQELYKEVGSLDLEDFDLNNNVSVIGESTENISLDEIKDILSEKYRETERRKSIGDTEEISLPKINLDETREYDLNSVLEKVKESKEINYEEERLKKVRNSQYDILKDLDILANEEEIEEDDIEEIVQEREVEVKVVSENEKGEKQLLELIDTIVAKELIDEDEESELEGELDPLDILSDLRGDDTKVMGAIQLDEENSSITDVYEETSDLKSIEEDTDNIEYIEEDDEDKIINSPEVKIEKVSDNTLSNSFMTESLKITQDDFEDFSDLKENGGIGKLILKLLIFGVVVAFIVGLILLIKNG